MIYVHTTDTETLPMVNCGEGYVYAKLDGGRARKCIQEQEYNIMIEKQNEEGQIFGFIILGSILFSIILAVILARKGY